MKKTILTTVLLALSTFLFAQNAPVDFEAGGNGADWNWEVFENGPAPLPALEIINNPDASGANTSAKVAKFTARASGAPWAGTTSAGIGSYVFDASNPVVKIMVWKTVISDVGIKLEAAGGWAEIEIKVPNTKTNEWEELTFDFTGRINPPAEQGGVFGKLTVFPDFREGREENVIYFDNIVMEGFAAGTTGGGGGTVGASSYCDTEVTHLGIAAETASAIKLTINNVNANSMKVAITSANDDAVDDLIIPGDVTGSPTISAKDESVAGTISVTLTWNAAPPADVALNILWSKASFGGNWQLSEQPITVKFNDACDGTGGGGGGTGEVVEVSTINYEVDGNGADWNWEVFENGPAPMPALEIINNPDATGGNTSAKVAKFTALAAGAPWAGTTSAGIGAFTFSATNPIIKIMVWKSVISDVGIKLEAAGGWAEIEIKVPNTKTNEWEELTFDFTGRVNPPQEEGGAFGKVTVFPDFREGREENIIYFDNIVFEGFNSSAGGSGGGGGTGGTAPTAAAPAPTANASDVISLFSDAYTDVTVDTWRTDWSAATLEDVTIDGSAMKKYSALNFVGIETVANQINISSNVTHFHVDAWSADFTQFRIKLVDFGPDGAFDGGDDTEHELTYDAPAQGEWIGYDIPIAEFVNLTTKSNISQLIFSALPSAAATVFIDNVYFVNKEATSTEEPGQPKGFVLSQNYPNPFNPSTTINYSLAQSNNVTLEVFSIQGQRVATLVNGVQSAGTHSITFDASNLASGMYTYRLTSGTSVIVKKMMLLK